MYEKNQYDAYQAQGMVYLPDRVAEFQRQIAEEREDRQTAYLQAYTEATGQFLEYVCGYPLPNPLTGCTV